MTGQNPLAFLAQSFANAVTMGRVDNARARVGNTGSASVGHDGDTLAGLQPRD